MACCGQRTGEKISMTFTFLCPRHQAMLTFISFLIKYAHEWVPLSIQIDSNMFVDIWFSTTKFECVCECVYMSLWHFFLLLLSFPFYSRSIHFMLTKHSCLVAIRSRIYVLYAHTCTKKWRRKFHTGSNMVWLHRCGIRTTLTAISLFFGWLCGKCESTRKGRRAHRLTDMTEISTHTHIHIHRKVQILCWTAYCNAIIPKVLSFAII